MGINVVAVPIEMRRQDMTGMMMRRRKNSMREGYENKVRASRSTLEFSKHV